MRLPYFRQHDNREHPRPTASHLFFSERRIEQLDAIRKRLDDIAHLADFGLEVHAAQHGLEEHFEEGAHLREIGRAPLLRGRHGLGVVRADEDEDEGTYLRACGWRRWMRGRETGQRWVV